MPSSILNSDDGVISGTAGLKNSGGDDGNLEIQNNGTTAVSISPTALNFSNTGYRITGDFSNATIANRVTFQSSTTNGATTVFAAPNGTSATAGFFSTNSSSDPANGSEAQIQISAAQMALISSRRGTGTFLPMTFFTSNSERMRIDTSGNVGIGTSSPSIFATRAALDIVGPAAGNGGLIRLADAAATSVLQIFANTSTPATSVIRTTTATSLIFGTDNAERMRIDSAGNLLFNSGFGSAGLAFGCRAWVNFNGTGTVAIRASGNVSSITDNGTGNYTVNFTTAMPDANYCGLATSGNASANVSGIVNSVNRGTGSCQIFPTVGSVDAQSVDVVIFR